MKTNTKGFILLLFLINQTLTAATVDTIRVYSSSMQKEIKNVIILPDSYKKNQDFKVVYLLHGYSDNYSKWVNEVPDIKKLADLHNFIIVCPDGGYGSWYWDSPKNPEYKYETYIIQELIPHIDQNYKTKNDRNARAITGLSMGGHGALYLAFRHQDLFAHCGSQSGGVDIRPFPGNWQIKQLLGTYDSNKENWESHTVINMLNLLEPGKLNIIIECGTEDFFYEVNKRLHIELLYRNIPHVYTESPGKHNWDYWRNSIHYQFLFFSRVME